jgi:hypothetical protein
MNSIRIVLIFSLFTTVFAACKMNYPTGKIDYHASDASVIEGRRLAMMTCGPCHFNPSTNDFSGKQMNEVPGIVGKIYAANITQDMEAGIGEYTEGELQYLVRTGISRTGKLLPFMQRPNLADDDLKNIIAFLKSDDSLVKPNARVPGKTDYSIVGKLAVGTATPLPYHPREIKKPENDQLALGRYLVDNLACFHCHSKSFVSLDMINPEKSKGYLDGGNKMKNAAGRTVKSPNLTFQDKGIKNWTMEEFKRAIMEGINKKGELLTYPMPMFPELTDEEVLSIYIYFKSV